MENSLTDKQLERLLEFIGYGVLNAEYWFLGMEEGGGGEDNVRARLKFKQLEDCAEAHKILGITKHHFGKRIIQQTWRGMCYIMLRLINEEPNAENIRNYQAEKLGRFNGNTLLYELMPLPKPSISKWGYEKLIPQFKSRIEYYEKVRPQRIKLLQKLYKENTPKVVIAYGKSSWDDYKELFPGVKFIKQDQFLVGEDKDTKIVFTGHFTAKIMNGKFDDVVSIVTDG